MLGQGNASVQFDKCNKGKCNQFAMPWQMPGAMGKRQRLGFSNAENYIKINQLQRKSRQWVEQKGMYFVLSSLLLSPCRCWALSTTRDMTCCTYFFILKIYIYLYIYTLAVLVHWVSGNEWIRTIWNISTRWCRCQHTHMGRMSNL